MEFWRAGGSLALGAETAKLRLPKRDVPGLGETAGEV
jgi:hypothetical protein